MQLHPFGPTSIKPKTGLTHFREYEAYIKASHFRDASSMDEIYDEYLNKTWTVFATPVSHIVRNADLESMLVLWSIILPTMHQKTCLSHSFGNL